MTMTIKGFAERLKHYRLEAGLSQRELSRRLGMSESVVSQWEGGVSGPVMSRISDVAAALRISPRMLFDPDVPPPLEPRGMAEVDEGWGGGEQ